ncbi:MAG: Hsp20/alpha crystallin family protein [Rhodospirillales bacterium]|jgi:HSP20 family protein|nr:Hsp20/alpha crystallin family protein [Rhodospirillales bacterium]
MATPQVQVKQTAPTPVPAPSVGGAPDMFRAFRGEMDRLFDRFFPGFPSFLGLPRTGEKISLTTPAVEVTESEADYRIAAELPGMKETDIEVGVSGDTLTLKGEKRQETERKDANTYFSERSYGAFERSFLLPDGVDREKIAATFDKGVLTVTLPKTEAAKQESRKIEVKTAT